MSGELHAAQGFPLTLRSRLSKGERKAFFNGLLAPVLALVEAREINDRGCWWFRNHEKIGIIPNEALTDVVEVGYSLGS